MTGGWHSRDARYLIRPPHPVYSQKPASTIPSHLGKFMFPMYSGITWWDGALIAGGSVGGVVVMGFGYLRWGCSPRATVVRLDLESACMLLMHPPRWKSLHICVEEKARESKFSGALWQ